MLGVTALEGIFPPVSSQNDQLYQSSRTSTMKSALYTVELREYPLHPGQHLVKITDGHGPTCLAVSRVFIT